jgi:hypothetical protein
MAQMGFFDLSDGYASLDAMKDPLAEIGGVVPWEKFARLLSESGASQMRITSLGPGASR